jgi:transposase-like protein
MPELASRIRSDADAYEFLEELQWPNGERVCPHCGSIRKHYYLAPRGGTARQTRTGALTERRVWKCAVCRRQFSVLTGTIFHGSKVPVRTWVFVMFEWAASENGLTARDLERRFGVSLKTASLMIRRIHGAGKRDPFAAKLARRVASGGPSVIPREMPGRPRGRGRTAPRPPRTVSALPPAGPVSSGPQTRPERKAKTAEGSGTRTEWIAQVG